MTELIVLSGLSIGSILLGAVLVGPACYLAGRRATEDDKRILQGVELIRHHTPKAIGTSTFPARQTPMDFPPRSTGMAEGLFTPTQTPAGRRWVEGDRVRPKGHRAQHRATVRLRLRQWWTCTTPRDIHAAVNAAETWTEPLVAVIPAPVRELVSTR